MLVQVKQLICFKRWCF